MFKDLCCLLLGLVICLVHTMPCAGWSSARLPAQAVPFYATDMGIQAPDHWLEPDLGGYGRYVTTMDRDADMVAVREKLRRNAETFGGAGEQAYGRYDPRQTPRRSYGDASNGYQGNRGQASAPASSEDFSLSGGVGNAGAIGNAATSPAMDIALFGVSRSVSSSSRCVFRDPAGLGITVTADMFRSQLKGSSTFKKWYASYVSDPRPLGSLGTGEYDVTADHKAYHLVEYYGPGDQVEASLTSLIAGLSADWNILPTFARSMGNLPLSLGPRIQWLYYSEEFEKKKVGRHVQIPTALSDPARAFGGSKDFSCGGAGMFAEIDIASAAGISGPGLSPLQSLRPTIRAAGAVGRGKGLQYHTWECTFRMTVRPPPLGGVLSFPGVVGEVGYIGWSVKQTSGKTSYGVLTSGQFHGGVDRSQDMLFPPEDSDLTMGSYIARAYLTF